MPTSNSQALDQSTSPLTAKLVPFAEFQALQVKFNALCAKLDADAGVTDTNYTATLAIATPLDSKPRAV